MYILKRFRMHFIFVKFVCGGFRTKIKRIVRKAQSQLENPPPSAAVGKLHTYERSEIPSIRKFRAYEIFSIYRTSQRHCSLHSEANDGLWALCVCQRWDHCVTITMVCEWSSRASSRSEERKILEPGWDVLNFRLRSYRTSPCQIGPETFFQVWFF